MSVSFTLPGLHCTRIHGYVSLNQTEAQCREAHKCGPSGKCPLENELGQDFLTRTLASLAEDQKAG